MKQKWEYDPRTDTYLFGTENDGAGIFVDDTIPESNPEGCWTGNVVVQQSGIMIGYFFSMEAAMEEAEKIWEKLHQDA